MTHLVVKARVVEDILIAYEFAKDADGNRMLLRAPIVFTRVQGLKFWGLDYGTVTLWGDQPVYASSLSMMSVVGFTRPVAPPAILLEHLASHG